MDKNLQIYNVALKEKRAKCYDMVTDCLTVIMNGEYITIVEAFEKFLEYCSVQLYLGSSGVHLKEETMVALDQIFDLELLKDQDYDVLGSVYYDVNCSIDPSFILSKVANDKTSTLDSYFNESHLGFPQAIFIDKLDTAGYLINKTKNVMVYTTSSDLTSYRISIINKSLYGLSLFNLFTSNKDTSKIDLDPSSSNWEFANRWIPIKTCHLV